MCPPAKLNKRAKHAKCCCSRRNWDPQEGKYIDLVGHPRRSNPSQAQSPRAQWYRSCKLNSSSLHIFSPLAAWLCVKLVQKPMGSRALPTPVVLHWTSSYTGFGGSPLPLPQLQAIETLKGPWVEVFSLCTLTRLWLQTWYKRMPKFGLEILKLQCRACRHLHHEEDKKDWKTLKMALVLDVKMCPDHQVPEQLGYFLPHTSHTVL